MKTPLSKSTWALIVGAVIVAAFLNWKAGSDQEAGTDDLTPLKLGSGKPHAGEIAADATAHAPGSLDQRMLALAQRGASDADPVDLFPSVSYRPPPPPPPPPAKPVAPPFPYTVIGTLTDSDETIYLAGPSRVIAAKVAQVIDGSFRIDSVASGHVTVTYLPLQQHQVIAFGGAP